MMSSAGGKAWQLVTELTQNEATFDAEVNVIAENRKLLKIVGFLNLILWAGNCWFIYKETPFHKVPAPPTTMEEGGAPGP